MDLKMDHIHRILLVTELSKPEPDLITLRKVVFHGLHPLLKPSKGLIGQALDLAIIPKSDLSLVIIPLLFLIEARDRSVYQGMHLPVGNPPWGQSAAMLCCEWKLISG